MAEFRDVVAPLSGRRDRRRLPGRVLLGILLASGVEALAMGMDAQVSPAGGSSSAPAIDHYLALDRFYIRVEDRCVAWEVRDRVARNRRQTPLGELVLEIHGSSYRRLGPVERLKWRLQSLACRECAIDPYSGQPDLQVGEVSCSLAPSAGWYATRAECQGGATRAPGERTIRHCVIQALTTAGMREGDARDARAYARVSNELKAAETAARARLRAFQKHLARTRVIYERQASGCRAWRVRQDRAAPSGWLSRREADRIIAFRFEGRSTGFSFSRPKITPIPKATPIATISASDCHPVTTLTMVDARQATFTQQAWYFSRAACEAAPVERSNLFGPGCF